MTFFCHCQVIIMKRKSEYQQNIIVPLPQKHACQFKERSSKKKKIKWCPNDEESIFPQDYCINIPRWVTFGLTCDSSLPIEFLSKITVEDVKRTCLLFDKIFTSPTFKSQFDKIKIYLNSLQLLENYIYSYMSRILIFVLYRRFFFESVLVIDNDVQVPTPNYVPSILTHWNTSWDDINLKDWQFQFDYTTGIHTKHIRHKHVQVLLSALHRITNNDTSSLFVEQGSILNYEHDLNHISRYSKTPLLQESSEKDNGIYVDASVLLLNNQGLKPLFGKDGQKIITKLPISQTNKSKLIEHMQTLHLNELFGTSSVYTISKLSHQQDDPQYVNPKLITTKQPMIINTSRYTGRSSLFSYMFYQSSCTMQSFIQRTQPLNYDHQFLSEQKLEPPVDTHDDQFQKLLHNAIFSPLDEFMRLIIFKECVTITRGEFKFKNKLQDLNTQTLATKLYCARSQAIGKFKQLEHLKTIQKSCALKSCHIPMVRSFYDFDKKEQCQH